MPHSLNNTKYRAKRGPRCAVRVHAEVKGTKHSKASMCSSPTSNVSPREDLNPPRLGIYPYMPNKSPFPPQHLITVVPTGGPPSHHARRHNVLYPYHGRCQKPTVNHQPLHQHSGSNYRRTYHNLAPRIPSRTPLGRADSRAQ